MLRHHFNNKMSYFRRRCMVSPTATTTPT